MNSGRILFPPGISEIWFDARDNHRLGQWSPDGKWLATTTNSGIVIWNVASGTVDHVIALEKRIGPIAWSPDSTHLAVGRRDTIEVYDATRATLSQSLSFAGPTSTAAAHDYVGKLLWVKPHRLIALSARFGAYRVFDPIGGQEDVIELEVSRHITCAAAGPGAELVALGGANGLIFIVEPESGSVKGKIRVPELSDPWAMAWSHDGRLLAVGSRDRTISLITSEGNQTAILEGHTAPIRELSFSHDDQTLCSVSSDPMGPFNANGKRNPTRQASIAFWRTDTGHQLFWLDLALRERAAHAWAQFHPSRPEIALLHGPLTLAGIDPSQFPIGDTRSIRYTTAKVVLVGDSGVGKTGLGWRLAHGEFREHSSTHGQQFWLLDQLRTVRSDGTECEAVLWDLAGQPDYRLIHTLFLDDTDLALVLFDPSNHVSPLKGVEYWLRALRGRGARAPRMILVGSRVDRGGLTMSHLEMEQFCNTNEISGGYIGTSALSGFGLGELLAHVRDQIPWTEKVATVTTKVFKDVKDCVLGLREGTYRITDVCREDHVPVLLPISEIRRQVEMTVERPTELAQDDILTAVRHLANHGYVSILRTSAGTPTVLLAPDILNNLAASFIVQARRDPAELGALDEDAVRRNDYRFSELANLDESEQKTLLDAATVLFLEHNVCFRESLGTTTLLVFPALINQKKPPLDEAGTVDDVSYTVRGTVENVYAALVVLLGYTNTFTRKNQWQNQAQYELNGEVCGFRQTGEREGEIEIVLYYGHSTSPRTKRLFEGLFETFLYARDVNIVKYPPLTCPKCGYPQERAELVRRIKAGKTEVCCSDCGERITIPKVGMALSASAADRATIELEHQAAQRRTAFAQALTHLKGFLRDTPSPSCFISYAWGEPSHEKWVEKRLAVDLQSAGVTVILDRWHNSEIGSSVPRFVSLIEESKFVVAVGTPLYRQKYVNKVSSTGSVVASEVDMIAQRLIGTEDEKKTVLPVLLEGDTKSSLPPLLVGRVHADFRKEGLYFAHLLDLILTLYRVPFDTPAVRDLRESLRG